MGSTIYHGRRVTTTDTAAGTVPSDGQRAYVPDELTQTMIAYGMGILGGRASSSSTPTCRMGIGETSTDEPTGAPDDLLAYTVTFNPSHTCTSGADGVEYTANLTEPILLTPRAYALVMTSRGNAFRHAMRVSGDLSEPNENFYTKSGTPSSVPTDPIGGTPSIEGHMDLWIIGETNTAPSIPTSLVPSGVLVSTDTTPQIESDFADAEETLNNGAAWDYVAQVGIQVRRKSDQVIFWNHVYTTTTTERNAGHANKTYAGTALVAGVDYEVRTRHADRAGAWSSYTSWVTFSINAGGTAGTPSVPTGKQLTLTPTNVQALWTHPSSLQAKAMQVRLIQGGVVIKTSPVLTGLTIASGAVGTMTWAQTGFGNLVSGGSYQVDAAFQDTGNAWSAFSGNRSFTIDATPAVPSSLKPASPNNVVSSRPKLLAKTSDADDVNSALTLTFEITRADTSTVTRTATWNATTGQYEYQTTSTDLPSTQTFTYRARATDGTFTSAWTSPVTVIYGTGPAITITAPTASQVFSIATPTFSWTVTGQVSRRVRIYQDSNDALVHDSGTTTTGTTTYAVPSGVLRQGILYYVVVDVTNSTPLTGTSDPQLFSLSYAGPPAPNVVAQTKAIGTDAVPSVVELSWGPTTYPADQFVGWDVWRRVVGGSYAAQEISEDNPEGLVFLRRISSPVQTWFVDDFPRSGVEYEWLVYQTIEIGLDTLSSTAGVAQASVTLENIILSSVTNPSALRVDLSYLGSNIPGASHPLQIDQRQVIPISARKGRTIRSRLQQWTPSGTFNIVSDRHATAEERIALLRACVLQGKTYCYRDDRGRKIFVTFVAYQENDRRGRYEVELGFREEAYTEGEAA